MSTNNTNTFRATYPIDFDLYDKDSQNVLYIEDSSDQLLTLEIRNASNRDIVLKDLGTAPLSATNYHFALRFRPGTIAKTSLTGTTAIQLTNNSAKSNWEMLLTQHDSENWDAIYLRKTTAHTLKCATATEKEPWQSIVFNHVGADAGQGPRGTRVQLICTNMNYQGSQEPINTMREINMGIINHRGKKTIPLQLGFVGGNTVVNDGKANKPLILRIANIAPYNKLNPTQSNITFKYDAKDATKTTKLFLTFQSGTADDAWALDTDAIITNSITIEQIPGWQLTLLKQGEKTIWILSPAPGNDPSENKTITLPSMADPTNGAQCHFDIAIKNIISNFPCGQTHLYIYYQNIPGYWDGSMACIIEKTPIKVGRNLVEMHGSSSGDNIPIQIVASHSSAGALMGFIGLDENDQKKDLLVIGASGESNNINNYQRPLVIKNVYTDDKEKDKDKKNKVQEMARFTTDGKLGIGGITAPTAIVDIAPNKDVPALQLHNGNSLTDTTENQITLGYNDPKEKDACRHTIRTRHDSSKGEGNAIDFYVWDKENDKAITTIGTKHTLSMNNGKVGIGGITDPQASIDVAPNKDIPALQLHNGNISTSTTENQITLGYNDTSATNPQKDVYRHAIKTRHDGNAGDGNAIDFYVWDKENDKAITTIGTKHTLSLNNGKVGIGGITDPVESLEVKGKIICTVQGDNKDYEPGLTVTNGRVWSNYTYGGLEVGPEKNGFFGMLGTKSGVGIWHQEKGRALGEWIITAKQSNGFDGPNVITINGKLFITVVDQLQEEETRYMVHKPSNSEIGWYDSSDKRLKKNIATIPAALEAIQQLRGVSYQWNEEGLQQKTKDVEENYRAASNTPEDNARLWEREKQRIRQENARTFHGFIAQEVETIFPNWVKDDKDGYKTINMDELAPVMVEALKTQQQQINNLQTQLNMLMKEVDALKNNH